MSLTLRSRFDRFVSGPKIPFPGNRSARKIRAGVAHVNERIDRFSGRRKSRCSEGGVVGGICTVRSGGGACGQEGSPGHLKMQVPRQGTVGTTCGDDPERVVVRLTLDRNGPIELTRKHRKVAFGGGIDGNPRTAYVLGRDSGHLFGAWVSHAGRDVGFVVSGDQRFSARHPIDTQDRCLVAADGTAQEPSISGAIDVQRFSAEDVVGLDGHDLFEGGTGPFQDRRSAPLVSRRRCEPKVQPAVGNKARDFILVLVDEPALARADVDEVQVVPSCVAVVHPYGYEIRVLVVHAKNGREHGAVRRQIARVGAADADAPEIEVLVAVPVLAEQHVRIGAREPVLEDGSVGLAGKRAALCQVVSRRHPDVHDAIDGGDPGEPAPVGRKPGIEGIGILEEGFTRNEWNTRIADHTDLA